MIQFLKNLNESNKVILSNFFSLLSLQTVNILLPLIVFPYLVKVLGIEKYGLIIFAQAFASYFLIITEYGFNLSGTRKISLHKKDKIKLNDYFNSILQSKILLTLLSLFIVLIIVFAFEKFRQDKYLYLLTFSCVFGSTLFPVWFFQGIEKMKQITILNFISKSLFTILILVFVNSPDDYLLVPAFQSFGFLLIGFISIYLIKYKYGIRLKITSFKSILQELKEGVYIFLSNISTNIYSATGVLILGFIGNEIIVGIYGVAEKLIRIIASLFYPLSQAIYPRAVYLVSIDKQKAFYFLKKILIIVFLTSLLITFLALIFGEFMISLIVEEYLLETLNIFQYLSPLLVVLPISIILFHNTLLSFKLDRFFLMIYLIGSITNLVLLYILIFLFEYQEIGVVISLLICEFLVLALAFRVFYVKVYKVIF